MNTKSNVSRWVCFSCNKTMVEKHGLIITFGQQGNIGSTANWLTLVIASLATISVMNGKVNNTVRQRPFIRVVLLFHRYHFGRVFTKYAAPMLIAVHRSERLR